ncbi:hypothetical protein ACQJBY_047900 [Aegilops geniculata]
MSVERAVKAILYYQTMDMVFYYSERESTSSIKRSAEGTSLWNAMDIHVGINISGTTSNFKRRGRATVQRLVPLVYLADMRHLEGRSFRLTWAGGNPSATD